MKYSTLIVLVLVLFAGFFQSGCDRAQTSSPARPNQAVQRVIHELQTELAKPKLFNPEKGKVENFSDEEVQSWAVIVEGVNRISVADCPADFMEAFVRFKMTLGVIANYRTDASKDGIIGRSLTITSDVLSGDPSRGGRRLQDAFDSWIKAGDELFIIAARYGVAR